MTTKSLVLVALAVVTTACAHHQPRARHTVSAVTNREVTRDPAEQGKTKMTYTEVSEEDALNHDDEHEQLDAMYGSLGRGNAPEPALRDAPRSESEQAAASAAGRTAP